MDPSTWRSSRYAINYITTTTTATDKFPQEGSKRDETIVSALSLYDGLV
jgi:hypothetical protein